MPSVYCARCGRASPEGARFCSHCGAPLVRGGGERPGESTSDTLRRALRLLDHERWLAQFRADAENLKDEDVNTEPEAW